jgi:hypothetical protein
MSPACPIANEVVDEWAARLCSLLVLIVLGLSLRFASPWPALFLALDFGLRGFGARRASPLARLAQWLAHGLRTERRPTNAGPKAFAAKLGLGFSLAVGLALLGGGEAGAMAISVPFALCAILEAAAGLCVGCRIYQVWQRARPGALRMQAPPEERFRTSRAAASK